MASPHSFSFSKPAMPGDAVSVLVLVEDSGQMAAKWPEVRASYLPILLENLRAADTSVQMEARWLTTSSSSSVATHAVMDAAQCRNIPELALGQVSYTKISPMGIHQAIQILASASRGTNATRHFILVAATGPPSSSPMTEATPSGFDPWDDIALVLKQEYIRLHVILNIGAEMRTYHELFKRSLQLQSNSEVPAWFPVDSRKYSIRLSGRPQYVRSSVAVPVPLIPAGIPQGHYGNPSSPPPTSKPASPPTPPTQDGSPPTSPHHRKTATSPTTPRTRGRGSESSSSPHEGGGGGGLVSYLQQMHGLTKKKSYGVKAPKKTYADIPLPMPGRPILPRLEVPQSDIYTYPSFDAAHTHASDHHSHPHALVSDSQQLPNRRHSADQVPPSSLVTRTNTVSIDERRARRRGPWLPIAPLASSTPSSPTSVTSPSTIAALQSLASMTPRLPPDFAADGRAPEAQDAYAVPTATAPPGSTDAHGYAAHGHRGMAPHPADGHPTYPTSPPADQQGYYYAHVPGGAQHWSQQGAIMPTPASPASAPSPTHTTASGYSDVSRAYSDMSYGSSPPSSAAPTPQSLAASTGLPESGEDQPFIMPPEFVANADAQYEQAVRSGQLQEALTPVLYPGGPGRTMTSPTFAASEPMSQDLCYVSGPSSHGHAPGYSIYHSEVHDSAELPGSEMHAGWYGSGQGYQTSVPGYLQQQHDHNHWYASA